jgi:flagellar protein FlaG
MSMEITNNLHKAVIAGRMGESSARAEVKPRHEDKKEPTVTMKELENIALLANKRLKFSINDDLGQVVVKVIDANTNKVIKELPPKELQRLHVRIREAVALLIDESI